MAYGTEAKIPVLVGKPSPRRLHFSKVVNEYLHKENLDLQEERHANSQLRLAVYQRKVEVITLGPTWEGPYKVIEEVRPETYNLEDSDGKETKHPYTFVRTINSLDFCFC
ncbi:Ribonuclease H [Abeliophyllum distichum]|uniref:Ribonuclease H n=1 Tax=Abeliophyllum distichum TaxID=126358 RepID=A0ABD1Q1W3_9LAMI